MSEASEYDATPELTQVVWNPGGPAVDTAALAAATALTNLVDWFGEEREAAGEEPNLATHYAAQRSIPVFDHALTRELLPVGAVGSVYIGLVSEWAPEQQDVVSVDHIVEDGRTLWVHFTD